MNISDKSNFSILLIFWTNYSKKFEKIIPKGILNDKAWSKLGADPVQRISYEQMQLAFSSGCMDNSQVKCLG